MNNKWILTNAQANKFPLFLLFPAFTPVQVKQPMRFLCVSDLSCQEKFMKGHLMEHLTCPKKRLAPYLSQPLTQL